MAETTKKQTLALILDNGTTASGSMKTKTVSYGTLSLDGYTEQRALAIAPLLSSCLTMDTVEVRHTIISTLESE